jgi:hypothetical protein
LPLGIVAKLVVDPRHAGRDNTWEVGRNDVTGNAAAARRVGISLSEVETRISAKIVGKLSETFVSKAEI